MTDVPRLKLEELLLEVDLTSKRHLVVEGPSDQRFFRAWALGIDAAERVAITSVDEIEIDTDLLLMAGLNDSNRARVLIVAREAAVGSIDLKCVADRDCGHGVDQHAYATLLWTDYPSIESYAVDEATLDRANLLAFSGKLPPAGEILPGLSFALAELYCVRSYNQHLPRPNYESGFSGTPRDLARFDVKAAVEQRIRGEVESYPRPVGSDVRSYSYGHDVAELLLAVFGNALKNQAGLHTRDAVEGALRSAIHVVGSYRDEALFQGLQHWIFGGIPAA